MLDRWFRVLRLPMSIEQFHRLPRNPAFQYEYLEPYAQVSPRPRSYHCRLELAPMAVPPILEAGGEAITVRRLADGDWPSLSGAFAGAFCEIQPFAGLDDAGRLRAAVDCLEQTRNGDEGALIGQACRVAVPRGGGEPLGAAVVTIMREVDLCSLDDPIWTDPPADWLERRLGRPHLTWIFVGPGSARHGVGTALLASCGNALLDLGYRELMSTFLLGNESSALWHWRNGFELLSYPGSPRRLRARARREGPPS